MKNIKKILIANRSEIAIRISRAATELGYKQFLFILMKIVLLFTDLKLMKAI
jgi:biotin carboxylase